MKRSSAVATFLGVVLLLAAFAAEPLHAATGVPLWVAREEGSGADSAEETRTAARLVDGSVMVVATTASQVFALRYDTNGTLLTTAALEAPSAGSSWVITSFGEVVVADTLYFDGSYQRVWVMKFDGYTGRAKWPKLHLVGDGAETVYSGTLRVGPTGDVYFGTSRRTATTQEAVVVKINGGDGLLEWRSNVDLGPQDSLSTMEIASDGDVVFAGKDTDGYGVTRLHLVALDGDIGYQKWDVPFSAYVTDRIQTLAFDYAGWIVAAGKMRNGSGNDDAMVRKYTPSGSLSWSRLMDSSGRADSVRGVAFDNANNVYFAGTAISISGSDLLLGRISSSGSVQWTKSQSFGNYDECVDILLDANGDAIVSAWVNGQSSGVDADTRTLKYSGTSGDLIWYQMLNLTYTQKPVKTLLDSTGDLFVAGVGDFTGGAMYQVELRRLDASNGSEKWGRQWGESLPRGNFSLTGSDAAGNVVTFRREPNGRHRISKFTANGSLVFTTPLPYQWDNAAFNALVVSPAGAFALLGSQSSSYPPASQALVLYFDGASPGQPVWSRLDGLTTANDSNIAGSFTADGNLVVTGYFEQYENGPRNIQTRKLNVTDSSMIWWSEYSGGSNSAHPTSLAVNAAGEVAVAGRQYAGGDGYSHVALRLNADGTQSWSSLTSVGGARTDDRILCAIDDSGNVLITGADFSAGNGDIVTKKLAAADGAVTWATNFAGIAGGADVPAAILTDAAGDVVITGRSAKAGADTEIVVQKYAGTIGVAQWTNFFDDGAGRPDDATGLRLDGSGAIFVAGASFSDLNARDAIVLKFDAAGNSLWTPPRFDDAGRDQRWAHLYLAGSDPIVATANVIVRLGEQLAIVTSRLPVAGCGYAYSYQLDAANGVGPYTWSSPSLPGFLSLDPSTGVLSATSPLEGSWEITVQVQDSSLSTATRTLHLDAFSIEDDVQIVAGSNPACNSTELSLLDPWSLYFWSTGQSSPTITVSPGHETLYGVTLGEGSCTFRGSIVVRGLEPLTSVSIDTNENRSLCLGATGPNIRATIVGGGTQAIQWAYRTSSGGTDIDLPGQTGTSYSFLSSHYPGVGTYYVVARVTASCGTAMTSNEIPITIADFGTPATLTAVPSGPRSVTLTWSAADGSGVDHYIVSYSEKGCSIDDPNTARTYIYAPNTTFTYTNLEPGHDYAFKVKAASTMDGCVSPPSPCATATAYGDCTVKPMFFGLAAVLSQACLQRLSWSPAGSNCLTHPAVTYNVYRSPSPTFTPEAANRIARCVATPFFDDLNPPLGTNYYIVRAEDSTTGNGGACNGGNEDTNVVRRSGVVSSPVIGVPFFGDNFDTARPSNADAYWTETYTSGGDQQSLSGCRRAGYSAQSYKIGQVGVCPGAYLSLSKQTLQLGGNGTAGVNGIALPAGSAIRLRFKHSYSTEASWDIVSMLYKTTSMATPAAISDVSTTTGPYIMQGGYRDNNGRRGWSGYQAAFSEVVVNLDALAGQTVWLSWYFTSDGIVNNEGYYLDDVVLETVTPVTCDVTGPVQAFTVTSRGGVNRLEWLNPASPYYGTTLLRYRTDGAYPTSATDGLPVGSGSRAGASDTYDYYEHAVTNGLTYRYAAFVQSTNGLVSGARTALGRAEAISATKWIYNTGATAMTPPGIASIFAVSNDRMMHSMQQGITGGQWPAGWRPFVMDGPSQARPSVVSMSINRISDAPKVAFVSSQDGYVYAINAISGAELWSTQIGQIVQGSPSLALKQYGIGLQNVDLVIAGTRNSSGSNGVYALNTQGGTVAWSYTGGGTYGIGIIGGQVSIDYPTRRVYFASRAASTAANQNHTLWCLTFDDTTVTRLWSIPLGDIDGSPIMRNNTLYVGTNRGVVHAIDPGSGTLLASYSTDDGPVKGFVFPGNGGRLYFSTTNRVWSLVDNLAAPRTLTLGWSEASIPRPSTAVLAGTSLWVGSSDGSLYRLSNLTDATPAISSAMLGNEAAAVGTIGYDYQNNLAYVGTAGGAIYAVSIP